MVIFSFKVLFNHHLFKQLDYKHYYITLQIFIMDLLLFRLLFQIVIFKYIKC